jgi:hypothetical protein
MHYSVDAIEARRVCPDTGTVQYLLKWEGYDAAFNSWEPRRHVVCCSDAVVACDQLEAKAACRSTSLFVARHQHRHDETSLPPHTPNVVSNSASKSLVLVVHDHALPPLSPATTSSTALESTNPLLHRSGDSMKCAHHPPPPPVHLQRLEPLEVACGETMLLAVEHHIRSTLTAASTTAPQDSLGNHAAPPPASNVTSKPKPHGRPKKGSHHNAIDHNDDMSASVGSTLQHERSWSTCHTEGLSRLSCLTQRTAWWRSSRSRHANPHVEDDDILARYALRHLTNYIDEEVASCLVPRSTDDDRRDEDLEGQLPHRRRRIEHHPVSLPVAQTHSPYVTPSLPPPHIEVIGLVPAWAYRTQFSSIPSAGRAGEDDGEPSSWLRMLQDDELVVLYSTVDDTIAAADDEDCVAVLPMPLSMFRELYTQELLDYLLSHSLVMTTTTSDDVPRGNNVGHPPLIDASEVDDDLIDIAVAPSLKAVEAPTPEDSDTCVDGEDVVERETPTRVSSTVRSVICSAIGRQTGFKCREFAVTVTHTYSSVDEQQQQQQQRDSLSDDATDAVAATSSSSPSPVAALTVRRHFDRCPRHMFPKQGVDICGAMLYNQKKAAQPTRPSAPLSQSMLVSQDGNQQPPVPLSSTASHRRCTKPVAFGLDVCSHHHEVAAIDTSLRCVAVVVGDQDEGDTAAPTRCQLPVAAGKQLCPYHFANVFHKDDDDSGARRVKVKRDSGKAYKRR